MADPTAEEIARATYNKWREQLGTCIEGHIVDTIRAVERAAVAREAILWRDTLKGKRWHFSDYRIPETVKLIARVERAAIERCAGVVENHVLYADTTVVKVIAAAIRAQLPPEPDAEKGGRDE